MARAVAAPQRHQKDGSQSTMGTQSQRRISQQERTHQLQSQSHRKQQKIVGQQTLFGGQAFDPTKNCSKCRGTKDMIIGVGTTNENQNHHWTLKTKGSSFISALH